MSRKSAREIAFHLIFEMGFKKFKAEEILMERLDVDILSSISGDITLYAGSISEEDKNYIKSVVNGVAEHLTEVDQLIGKNSKNWDIKRLSRVAMATLRLSITETYYLNVPVGTSINEAVELTKKYESQQTASFVNGILGTIARGK